MNATPIPEHLDKFHPPLLDQMSPDSSPSHTPAAMPQQMPQQMPPVSLPLPFPTGAGFPGLPGLYRPPMELLKSLGSAAGFPNPFFQQMTRAAATETHTEAPTTQTTSKESNHDLPTDLRKTSASNSPELPVKTEITEEKDDSPPHSRRPHSQQRVRRTTVTEALTQSTTPALDIKIKEERIDTDSQDEEIPRVDTPTPQLAPSPAPRNSLTPTHSSPAQPPITMHPHPSPGAHNHIDHLPTPGQLPPSLHHRDDFFAERFPLNFTKNLSPEHHSPIRSRRTCNVHHSSIQSNTRWHYCRALTVTTTRGRIS
ncbi:unnamed protein product [Ceratitis capitata]|uniref:(Mediterranean fruit fly) hypothetical protein n=1 Tax=Ceratitis capitata TaxID=7213 RepID=A0A811USS1_CERCA|nr:unnamed protein product [Ceratitis capitata]